MVGEGVITASEPRGLAACLDVLELIVTQRHYSELSLALPSGDVLLLLDPGKLAVERGETHVVTEVGGYRVEHIATNADSRRAMRRFARVVAIEPEPPFAVLVRVYKEPGYVMAKFDAVWRGCVRDRPRIYACTLGHAFELSAEVEIGDKTYTLRRP